MKGNLVLAESGTAGSTLAETLYSYDPLGRVANMWACAPSICGTAYLAGRPLAFTYDLAGDLLTDYDPAAGSIAYTYTVAGEAATVTNQTDQTGGNPEYLVSSVTNGPNGPTKFTLGNGLYNVNSYDTLGRTSGGWVCSGSTVPDCSGGSQLYGFAASWKGTQLKTSSDTILNQGASYTYDEFNRLSTRTITTGTAGNLNWVYDRWGNRWGQNVTSGSGYSTLNSFNTTTNCISTTGYQCDAAGNVTNDGFHTYKYDAEGNIIEVDSGSTAKYVYDALNQRVQDETSTSAYEYLYDYTGKRKSSWILNQPGYPGGFGNEGRIYFNGKQIAYRAADGNTYFDHKDWIGTERLRTSYTGTVAASFTSQPFGDGYAPNIAITDGSQDNGQFAFLDYDPEAGTSHAQFRQYSNAQGRWLRPDPYYGSYSLDNPQSLNRYAYSLNNPLGLIDPLGLDVLCFALSDYSYINGDYAVNGFGYGQICIDPGDGGGGGGGGSGSGGGGGGSSAPSKGNPNNTYPLSTAVWRPISSTCWDSTQAANTLGNWAKMDGGIALGVGTVGVLNPATSLTAKLAPEVGLVFGTTAAVEQLGAWAAGWLANQSCPQ